jgi:hypothetical protein
VYQAEITRVDFVILEVPAHPFENDRLSFDRDQAVR